MPPAHHYPSRAEDLAAGRAQPADGAQLAGRAQRRGHSRTVVALFGASAMVLAACSTSDPLAQDSESSESAPSEGASASAPAEDRAGEGVVIGTANFPESEIIGQIWAQALDDAGIDAEVSSGIGSREVYLSALEEGSVSVVPEYSGNLTQYYLNEQGDDSAQVPAGADSQEVYDQLSQALPDGISAGEYAQAESKDAYLVTAEVAEQYELQTIADLDNLEDITLAGNPELAERPYGPQGISEVYNVDADKITFTPISDGGGPLTIAALLSGQADVADIYTTSPHLDRDGNEVDLVTLEDPENLILPQNVVPVYRDGDLPAQAVDVLNEVNSQLSTEDLVAMNLRNTGEEKAEPVDIARDFLAELD